VARVGAEGLTERVLESDALLLAAPVVLSGLPGPMKSWLDGWLDIPPARLTPKTTRMLAGYVAVYAPDDDAIRDTFHRHVLGALSHLGLSFRGHACGFVPPGGEPGADLLRVAERLGAVLAGEAGYAGYPEAYLAGVRRFNARDFWEAHEDWEDLWLEAEEPYRLFFQGLIQVAAAFHHHARENWGGMAALLRDGMDKLEQRRPRLLGLDLDALLATLAPWRVLAEARAGHAHHQTVRVPKSLPTIALQDVPES